MKPSPTIPRAEVVTFLLTIDYLARYRLAAPDVSTETDDKENA